MAEPQGPGEPTAAIGVVLVDDHTMFVQSLGRLLELEDDLEVLGIGSNGVDARNLVQAFQPRVLLLDFEMPGETGVSVAADIKRRWPETIVVMITGSADDATLLAAIEAGCSGFVTKDRAAAEVAEAVRVAASGEALISPAQLARLLPRLRRTERQLGDDLTDREREVLAMMASGASNRDIAGTLFLSVNTVRNYVQSVLSKLGAHSKLEAVATAVREGIIESR